MNNCKHGALWGCSCGVVAVLSVFGTLACGGTDQPSIKTVEKAWKDRENRIRTAKFIWNDALFISAHSIPPMRPGKNKANGAFLPEKDVTLHRSVTLLVSKNMMRYSYEGQVFNVHKGGVRRKAYVSVTDGEISKNFHKLLDGNQSDYPLSGFIRKESRNYDFDNRQLAPVLMACRPCDTSLGGIDLNGYKIGVKRASINGHPCHVVEPRVTSKQRWTKSYWVDVSRGCIVLRITCGRAESPPIYTIDVKYTQTALNGWIPTRWKVLMTGGNNGRLLRERSAHVVEYAINENIPIDEFRFDFPPKTAVVDNRVGKRYIVNEQGHERVVTREELRRGARYPDLLTSKSGEALKKTGLRASWLLVTCVVTFVTIAVVLWRRKRDNGRC